MQPDMLTLFFSPVGVTGRQEFTLGWLFFVCLELAGLFGVSNAPDGSAVAAFWIAALTVASVVSTFSIMVMGIKRLRDAGQPVFFVLALLVPGISILLLLALTLMPSRATTASRRR